MNGVLVRDGGEAELHACHVTNNREYGVYLADGAGTLATLVDNEIRGNGKGSIALGADGSNAGGGTLSTQQLQRDNQLDVPVALV